MRYRPASKAPGRNAPLRGGRDPDCNMEASLVTASLPDKARPHEGQKLTPSADAAPHPVQVCMRWIVADRDTANRRGPPPTATYI